RSFLTKSVISLLLVTLCLVINTNGAKEPDVRDEAQKFIDSYTAEFNRLRTIYVQADWTSNTTIIEGDDTNSKTTNDALEKFSDFTGSKANIDSATEFLKKKDKL